MSSDNAQSTHTMPLRKPRRFLFADVYLLNLVAVGIFAFAALVVREWGSGGGDAQPKAVTTPVAFVSAAASPQPSATQASPSLPRGTAMVVAAVTPRPSPTSALTPVAPRGATGVLEVKAIPWVRVELDGRKVSEERSWSGVVTAGGHTVTLTNRVQNFVWNQRVMVPAGERLTIEVNVPANEVSVRATP